MRRDRLALGCAVAWALAAASAARLGVWLALGGGAVVLGVVVWVLDGAALRPTLEPSARRVGAGLALGLAMAGATHLAYPLAARLVPAVAADTARLYAAFRAAPLPVAALVLAPVVVGEELVWRGVVQRALVARLGVAPGVVVAAGVYALAHAPVGSALLVVVALACGLVWGGLRAASGSLVPSLVTHFVWDALVFFAWPLAPR